MMRVKHVTKAQKDAGDCQVCHEPIRKGMPYQWAKGRYTPKFVRHATCPGWRMSELDTTKMSTAYAAQEGAHDDIDALEPSKYLTAQDAEGNEIFEPEEFVKDIQSILNICAENASECESDYQEGFDNMPEGLQAGPTGQQSEERIEYLQSWQQELEGWEPQEEFDQDTHEYEQWAQEAIDSARAVIDGLEA